MTPRSTKSLLTSTASLYVPEFDLPFNQFLVKNDEPLLFHTGSAAVPARA